MGQPSVLGDAPAPEQHDGDGQKPDHAKSLPGEIGDDGAEVRPARFRTTVPAVSKDASEG